VAGVVVGRQSERRDRSGVVRLHGAAVVRFGEDWPWADDLGFFASVPDCAYEANSTDNPTTIAAAAVEGGALLSLNLPATDLARLIPGSYHGQIVATAPADETDMLELAHFKTVFR
jgi:hypothetical protein